MCGPLTSPIPSVLRRLDTYGNALDNFALAESLRRFTSWGKRNMEGHSPDSLLWRLSVTSNQCQEFLCVSEDRALQFANDDIDISVLL
jgi:hypothetical protein